MEVFPNHLLWLRLFLLFIWDLLLDKPLPSPICISNLCWWSDDRRSPFKVPAHVMLKPKCFWLHLFHPTPPTHTRLVFVAYLNVKTISSPALVASLKIPRCTLEIKVFNAFPFFFLSRRERSACWWLLASRCGCWYKISNAPCWEQRLQPHWRRNAELAAGVCCNTRPGGFASSSSSMMLLWFLYQSCCELE